MCCILSKSLSFAWSKGTLTLFFWLSLIVGLLSTAFCVASYIFLETGSLWRPAPVVLILASLPLNLIDASSPLVFKPSAWANAIWSLNAGDLGLPWFHAPLCRVKNAPIIRCVKVSPAGNRYHASEYSPFSTKSPVLFINAPASILPLDKPISFIQSLPNCFIPEPVAPRVCLRIWSKIERASSVESLDIASLLSVALVAVPLANLNSNPANAFLALPPVKDSIKLLSLSPPPGDFDIAV